MKPGFLHVFLFLVLSSVLSCCDTTLAITTVQGHNVLVIQGKALDSTGNPLSAANVTPFLNGKPLLPVAEENAPEKSYKTGLNGLFRVEIPTTVERDRFHAWRPG